MIDSVRPGWGEAMRPDPGLPDPFSPRPLKRTVKPGPRCCANLRRPLVHASSVMPSGVYTHVTPSCSTSRQFLISLSKKI